MIKIPEPAHINLYFPPNRRVSVNYGAKMYGSHYDRDFSAEWGLLSNGLSSTETLHKWDEMLAIEGAEEFEVAVFFNEKFVRTSYSDDIVIPYVNTITLIDICKWVIDSSD